jgi:hypothetical protein
MYFDSLKAHLRFYARFGAGAWLFARLVIPCFHLPSNVFSSMLKKRLNLPHPLALGLTHCICVWLLNPMGIHLHCCTHGGERIASHDAIQNAFASITRETWFHVLQEQTHIFPSPSL